LSFPQAFEKPHFLNVRLILHILPEKGEVEMSARLIQVENWRDKLRSLRGTPIQHMLRAWLILRHTERRAMKRLATIF
jgi:hypothetical protein